MCDLVVSSPDCRSCVACYSCACKTFPPQIVDLVWLVIPVRDLVSVDRLNQPNTLPGSILVSTRSLNNTIIFAHLADTQETIDTISKFMQDGAAHFRYLSMLYSRCKPLQIVFLGNNNCGICTDTCLFYNYTFCQNISKVKGLRMCACSNLQNSP